MKKLLLALVLALAPLGASAQNINKSVATSQDASGAIGLDTNNNIYVPNHLVTTGPPVSAPGAGCGTTITVQPTGDDFAGTVTVGSSATTTCAITFRTTWITAPMCIVGSNPQLAALSWTTNTTTLAVTQTSTALNVLNFICVGAK